MRVGTQEKDDNMNIFTVVGLKDRKMYILYCFFNILVQRWISKRVLFMGRKPGQSMEIICFANRRVNINEIQ